MGAMRLAFRLGSGIATAAMFVSFASISLAAGSTVQVVRCPTQYAIIQPHKTPPSIAVKHSPSSTRGLVAYTNGEEFLIGPAGMQCAGNLAVDGNGSLTVWSHGAKEPDQHSKSVGLTLTLIPDCVSCKAVTACPFFSQFAAAEQIPCPAGIPPGEHVYGLNSRTTLFEDPPYVAGSGWPSGGQYPANGIVGIGPPSGDIVYRATCTLPGSERWICTVSLNDALGRYGT
jgi:hypothetical protein